jgi:hypothetical protein
MGYPSTQRTLKMGRALPQPADRPKQQRNLHPPRHLRVNPLMKRSVRQQDAPATALLRVQSSVESLACFFCLQQHGTFADGCLPDERPPTPSATEHLRGHPQVRMTRCPVTGRRSLKGRRQGHHARNLQLMRVGSLAYLRPAFDLKWPNRRTLTPAQSR